MTDKENSPEQIPLRDKHISEVSSQLQETLGQRLVAYAIQEKDPKVIGTYARSESEPNEVTEKTLRDLAEVTETLLKEEDGSEESVRALMLGMNPSLDDESAIELFHQGESERVLRVASEMPYSLG